MKYFNFPLGWFPLQLAYLLGQRLDRWRRSRSCETAAFPVVCVGNFQAGGTGKTPVTLWVAHELARRGYAPIILLRGYKGATKKSTVVTANDAAKFGDEAVLHAQWFPTIVGKNRVESARLAQEISTSEKTVLLLDDGLQHYELTKDFSIVCQKSRFEFDTLLPQGRLREIPHTRIDAIINTVDAWNPASPSDWRGIPEFYLQRHTFLRSGSIERGLLVCGIGRPDDFFDHVKKAAGIVADEWAFDDHHVYTPKEVKRMEEGSKKYSYRVHCTAKDAVKLQPLIDALESPLKLSIWDVDLYPLTEVKPLWASMVGKIEEVYQNRPMKGRQNP